MFKKFNIYESEHLFLFESGNAVKNVSRININEINPTLDALLTPLLKELKLDESDFAKLGSVGKKESSGDIDILLNTEKIAQTHNLTGAESDVLSECSKIIHDTATKLFKDMQIEYSIGLNITHIAFPIYNKDGVTDRLVQVDLMVATGKDGLEFGSFIYHSPNMLNGESKYSGAHRTSFLFALFHFIPLNKGIANTEYFSEEYDGKNKGDIKAYSKYALSPKGLNIVRKSFMGKTKPTKNPKNLKEFGKFITKNPKEITKYALGPNGTINDLSTFENIVEFIESGKNKDLYAERKNIYNRWYDANKTMELPDEIKKYV